MQGTEKPQETDTYKALCLALVNKYYGHQNHRLHFAGSELGKWNADFISGGRKDLVDSYT